jgi:hypothetical protein
LEPSADVADAVLSALLEQGGLVVADVAAAGGAVTDAALRQADRIVLVAGEGLRQLMALAVISGRLRGRADVPAEMGVCLRVGSGTAAGAVGRLLEAELQVDVLCSVEEDKGVQGDVVHGVAPGSRAKGAVVRAADEVLGWVLLADRGAA